MANKKENITQQLEKRPSLVKENNNLSSKGEAYGNLGILYRRLGNFQKAIEFHQLHLQIAKEVGDRAGEGRAYGNLGNAYQSLGNFQKAIEFHQLNLQIAKEVGDRAGEGHAYGNLGNAYQSLGNYQKAIEFHQLYLQIAKEVGDRAGEGRAYGNLGNAYHSLGNFQKAIEFHQLDLQIAKEVGDRAGEGRAYGNLGNAYYDFGDIQKAIGSYHSSVEVLNNIRGNLQSEEAWKLSFRELYHNVYTMLWRALLKVGNSYEALCAAEHGRAQAFMDALKMRYGLSTDLLAKLNPKETISYLLREVSTPIAFLATKGDTVNIWFLESGNEVTFRRGKIRGESSNEDAISIVLEDALKEIGAGVGVRCENRTLDDLSNDLPSTRQGDEQGNGSSKCANNPLQQLYDLIISPISDLLQSGELIVVPDGPLCLAPWSALSESIRIRTVPSLTSLKLLRDVPLDFHSRRGALLVGDPCTKELRNSCGKSLLELPWARKEVEMIGKLLKTPPLTGNEATKAEVLNRLTSVGLVHIAAHGDKESGEIALAPNPGWKTAFPGTDRYMLKISDVQEVHLRASLVVLSCCHSGRGTVLECEGVVGIARAFLCAGARSVLVSLWAIDDEATMQFMKSFYQKLREEESTSVAVHHAMNSLQHSDRFCDMKHWAPFLLIGDDVKLDFGEKEHPEC